MHSFLPLPWKTLDPLRLQELNGGAPGPLGRRLELPPLRALGLESLPPCCFCPTRPRDRGAGRGGGGRLFVARAAHRLQQRWRLLVVLARARRYRGAHVRPKGLVLAAVTGMANMTMLKLEAPEFQFGKNKSKFGRIYDCNVKFGPTNPKLSCLHIQ